MGIVAGYTAVLILLFIGLTVNVIRQRQRANVALGTGDSQLLERAARAHSNFAEFTPLFLISLAIMAYLSAPAWLLHLLAIIFIIGRLSHASGLIYFEPKHDFYKARIGGMMLTFAALGTAATSLIILLWCTSPS